MRGRGKPIASVLTDALLARADAHLAALAAAFSEACGWPLAREVAVRALTREGRLVAVASSSAWAEQVGRLAPALVAKVNARMGRTLVAGIDVRVGPLDR